MTPEHDERFRRIAEDYLERPGGDYAELLRRGQVSSPDGVDPEEWRAEIRAKARADKIRVITIRDGDRAIAARQRSIPKDQELAELTRELDRSVVLRGLAERARQLGHEIDRWLRHDQENITWLHALPGPHLCPVRYRNPDRGRRSARRHLRVELTIVRSGGRERDRVTQLAR